MAFSTTQNAKAAAANNTKTIQMVLQIDGFEKLYGVVDIKKIIEYGDDIEYGDEGLVYGGLVGIENQSPYILWQGSTSTIRQQLDPDKGTGGSISSLTVNLLDKNGEVSQELVTPDETVSPAFDILGRKAKVWIGFDDTAWPEDFFVVFRGTVDSARTGAGFVTLNLNSPDSKKKGQIFARATNQLDGSITAGATVMTLDDASSFLDPTFTGPDGTIDSDIKYYVRIEDEIIRYEAKSATQLQTLTRGEFGTTAAAHADNSSVESIVEISGNSIDLALKLMLSGTAGSYESDVEISSFVRVDGTDLVDNAIFFENFNPVSEFNLSVGDFVTVTGATNGANNITLEEIVAITESNNGFYITINDSITLIEETPTSALISFRSKYDVWPEGARMVPDEVDILEHLRIQRLFLSQDDQYQILIRDEIELKEFISEQIYNPLGAFSLPRKSRASIGFHLAGLLPGGTVKTLDTSNITNANQLKIQRSTTKNFFNATVYKINEDFLEEDKFLSVFTTINTESRDRIPVGVRALIIEAKGLRTTGGMNGDTIATDATSRRLNKYKFGAEFIKGVRLNYETGYDLEVGDIVIFDLGSLKVTDIKNSGTRSGESRLFQIDNKSLNIKNGEVSLDIVDTNFDDTNRFGLISPSSFVKTGLSTTKFVIKESFNSDEFGQNEFLKWTDFIGNEVKVRNSDFSLNDSAVIDSINGNTITLETALSFIPSEGMIMEFANYGLNQPLTNAKLLYASMSDVTFADGKPQYVML